MKLRNKILLVLVALFSLTAFSSIMAQTTKTFKAMPDNYYIAKGGSKTLFVMNNDSLGACQDTPDKIEFKITLMPKHGTARQNGVRIQYRSDANDNAQQDTIKYQIKCGSDVSETTVYINISNKPDYLSEAECTMMPDAFEWRMRYLGASTKLISTFATPVAGKLAGDETMYIAAMNRSTTNTRNSDGIVIFDENLTLVGELTGLTPIYSSQPIALAKVLINGSYTTLIITTAGKTLRAYYFDPSESNISKRIKLVWIANEAWEGVATLVAAMSIADIDGDGNSEIICANKIYAAESGKVLVKIPTTPNSHRLDFLFQWGDVDGDGIMEAICGHRTYKVAIADRSGTNNGVNTINLLGRVNTAGYTSGTTGLADIDGDGILDVVVTAPNFVYVWSGVNQNEIIASYGIASTSRSAPFIGDIDGDGVLDICFTMVNGTTNYLYALYYDGSQTLQVKGRRKIKDGSGSTAISLFDFNLDGTAELVYRDEDWLQIIEYDKNPTTPIDDRLKIVKSEACFHNTAFEYPIVVRDKNNNSAIYLSGNRTTYANDLMYLMKFDGSNPSDPDPTKRANNWAPARPVWNQYAYNPTQVNEDLTIPQNPINRAAEIWKKDGTSWRPFNNQLVQTGPVDSYAQPYILGPDLTFNAGANQKLTHDIALNELSVKSTIVNQGDTAYVGDVKVDFYYFDPNIDEYVFLGTNTLANQTIYSKQTLDVTITVSNFSSYTIPADAQWFLFVNAKASVAGAAPAYYFATKECREFNNATSRISFVSGEIILCETDKGKIVLDPPGGTTYKYEWYLADGITPFDGLDADNTGDAKDVTKTAADVDVYKVKVLDYNTGVPMSPIMDEVHAYLSPDLLIWTGLVDNDWHNTQNWMMQNDPSRLKERTYIPRWCTDVLIPRGLDKYPDLRPTATDYSIY